MSMVNAIGETITQSVTVISAVTQQINKAVADGIAIYDKIKLKGLKSTLDGIQGQMVSVNAKKINNLQVFRDYIKKDAQKISQDDWRTIRNPAGAYQWDWRRSFQVLERTIPCLSEAPASQRLVI